MASFDDIPLEVQEQIFMNLTPSDLKECSLVSSKWYDIVNSNQIWLKMCSIEGLTRKKFLDDDFSLISNPIKQFSNETTLAPSCHWKSHYKRYKYVKKNWRSGFFVKCPVRFTPIHINENYIVQHVNNKIIIWDVCGKLVKFCSVELAVQNMSVDNMLWKGELMCYSQGRTVVLLKRGDKSFKECVRLELEAGVCSQIRNNCIKQKLTVRLSEKFLLVQDHLNPCMLSFYDTNKGVLLRGVDLHRALGNQSLFCYCLDVWDDKVFLAYRMSATSYLAKYNFSDNIWETPLTLRHEPMDLFLSKRYICLKLTPETRDNPVCFFQVWDHTSSMQSLEEIDSFYASKHLPIVLTDNDFVLYHDRQDLQIQNLIDSTKKTLDVSRSVMKFVPIWDRYLLLLDDKGVSLYDWKSGQKMDTPFRDYCCSTFYASETNIVIRRDDERFYIISYW